MATDTALNNGIDVIKILLRRVDLTLDNKARKLLLTPFAALDEQGKRTVAGLYDPLLRAFFHAAAEGHKFLPLSEIKEYFGASLEENYPGASKTFMNFAETYWTFKLVHGRMFPTHTNLAIYQLLGELEQAIASVFFPTPGPLTIGAKKREDAQRELIKESGAPIDVEDFISGNPILKAQQSTGCLGIGIAVLAIVVVLATIAKFIL